MLFIISLKLDTAGGICFQITHAMLTCKQSSCCADSTVQADCTLKKYLSIGGRREAFTVSTSPGYDSSTALEASNWARKELCCRSLGGMLRFQITCSTLLLTDLLAASTATSCPLMFPSGTLARRSSLTSAAGRLRFSCACRLWDDSSCAWPSEDTCAMQRGLAAWTLPCFADSCQHGNTLPCTLR